MNPTSPDACTTMSEVRAGVDAIDAELVGMIAHRFAYMRAAARIKLCRGDVRDEERKAAVIEAARAEARRHAIPESVIGEMWERLVEGSIAYELEVWERLNPT